MNTKIVHFDRRPVFANLTAVVCLNLSSFKIAAKESEEISSNEVREKAQRGEEMHLGGVASS